MIRGKNALCWVGGCILLLSTFILSFLLVCMFFVVSTTVSSTVSSTTVGFLATCNDNSWISQFVWEIEYVKSIPSNKTIV